MEYKLPVLAPGQSSIVFVLDVHRWTLDQVFEFSDVRIEAPNWFPNRDALLLNGEGDFFEVDLQNDGPTSRVVPRGPVPEVNNDHVLSPDGEAVFTSTSDGRTWWLRLDTSEAEPIGAAQHDLHEFVHGISPDGCTLVLVGGSQDETGAISTDIYLRDADGSGLRRLTRDQSAYDAPEFSPDGQWIYFNSDRDSPGTMKLFRMRPKGCDLKRVSYGPSSDWFPHLSPDGQLLAFVSFPPETVGHPIDTLVTLNVVRTGDMRPVVSVDLFGGQGAMNVPSWAADSSRLAFVAHPFRERPGTSPRISVVAHHRR